MKNLSVLLISSSRVVTQISKCWVYKFICTIISRQENEQQQISVKRFESRNHFKSRLSLIVGVNAVLNRTVDVDSD